MKNLAVLGLGSGGIQSLCHFLSWLDDSWIVTSIHDPEIPSLGIGESTNPTFITALQYGLNFDMLYDLEKLDGTLKIGTVYKNWRSHEFINPLISGTLAVHFNTHSLKDFALPRLKTRWGDKFQIITGNVKQLIDRHEFVEVVLDRSHNFDYVIDCRGFPTDFENYNVLDSYVNRALVFNSEKLKNWNYTGHRATKNGWMFEIPLVNRTSYGYLFNDKITDAASALEDFKLEIEENFTERETISYQFKSYYAKKIFENRILKNGNRAVFFEPMFANSLWLYNNINCYFVDYIKGDLSRDQVNSIFEIDAEKVRHMIAFNYHGGSTYQTEFWQDTVDRSKKTLSGSRFFRDTVNLFKEYQQYNYWIDSRFPYWVFPPISLLTLDRNFGYGYFS